jgi:hypothetical protein
MLSLRSLSPVSPFLTICPSPLYISSYSPHFGYYKIILPLLLFSLFHLFLYHFYPFHLNCLLCMPFFFSLNSAVSSFISLTMVFISLSISLLLFPSSLLLGDFPVLELFLNGFVPFQTSYPLLFPCCCFLFLLSAFWAYPFFLARCLLLITSHSPIAVFTKHVCSLSLQDQESFGSRDYTNQYLPNTIILRKLE